MPEMTREMKIGHAFVAVASALTRDFDPATLWSSLVQQCTDLLDADAGGVMLVNGTGPPAMPAAGTANLPDVMQASALNGPAQECVESGAAISVPDLSQDARWPTFRELALQNGFRSAHVIPLKRDSQVIGAMTLLSRSTGALLPDDAATAHALADVATIGMLQEQISQERSDAASRMHRALEARILVEQAKGVVAHSLTITIDDAFILLRAYARSKRVTILAVAECVTRNAMPVQSLILAGKPRKTSRKSISQPPKTSLAGHS